MIIKIEDLIPHRERMKLIDRVLELDESTAVTESTVTSLWPLYRDHSVHPIVIIELVAQTSGIVGGSKNQKKGIGETKGWIVGIKKAVFHMEKIPSGTRIITKAENRFVGYGNFMEVEGIAKIGSQCIGEITLHVIDDNGSKQAEI